jgi:hypothetical protein
MQKRRKAPLPPTQSAEADPRRQWIYQNRDRLVHQALDSYRTWHRGALVVYLGQDSFRTGKINVGYLSDRVAQASGRGWPTDQTAAMVRSYNPANEFVIVMIHLNGSVISYRVQFSKTTMTLVVSA